MLDSKNIIETGAMSLEAKSSDATKPFLYQSLKKQEQKQLVKDEFHLSSTGISALDRTMGGGLPAGSLTYFSADPRSMSEVFLYQFTQSRKTYYFTTSRKPRFVLNDVINLGFDPTNIVFVDIYSEYYCTACGDKSDNIGNEFIDAKIIDFTQFNLRNIANDSSGEEVNIIIDSFSFFMELTVNKGHIKQLVNVLYETTKDLGCLTYLYGLNNTTAQDIEGFTLNICDVIFESMLDKGADKVACKLAIPKIRGMVPSDDIIKFKIGEGIQIDTSRDIA